jgi:hypothetical protein
MHVPKTSMLMSMLIYTTLIYIYIKPVCQWRNVISGGPGSKFSNPPPVEVPNARVERHICTSFLGVQGSPGKCLNLDSLKCHFPDFGKRFYRILMVRKRHCNLSEALGNVFALQLEPGGGGIWPFGQQNVV